VAISLEFHRYSLEWVLLRDLNSQVLPESDFKKTGVLLAARLLRCLALDLVRPSALDARPLLSLSHHARKVPAAGHGAHPGLALSRFELFPFSTTRQSKTLSYPDNVRVVAFLHRT
jgi:hypothetical protein